MKFRENILLSKFSHYRIGGAARFFFEPRSAEEIEWAIREARTRALPVFILGGGTNLLLSDEGFAGLVLKPSLAAIASKGDRIVVDAGASMETLLAYSIKNSLSGLEWAGGLPGTLGGAIRGNAGCFGGEIKDVVATVLSFDPKKMKTVTRSAASCAFGYRDSIFKHGAAGEIILSATLRMKKGDKVNIAAAIREKIEYRVKNHPLEYPNIGSMFKNVPLKKLNVKSSKLKAINGQRPTTNDQIVFRGSRFSVKVDPFPVVSAAKMISEAGLRGVSFGGAMISAKHPNFIVNVLDASARDVKALLSLAKSRVKEKFGVILEEEVQIL